jgi:cell division protein FtsI (penicillin-binding protein 3)
MMLRARRLVLIFSAGLFVLMGGLTLRLAWLQVAAAGRAVERQERQSVGGSVNLARRGSLLDRHGKALGESIEHVQVTAWPPSLTHNGRLPRSPEDIAASLSGIAETLQPLVGVSASKLRNQLATAALADKPRLARLGPPVEDPARIDRLIQEQGPGGTLRRADFEPGWERVYPGGAVAGSLLGFVNAEGVGASGLEYGLQDELGCGVDGRNRYLRGVNGFRAASADQEPLAPLDGFDAVLSLDAAIQQMVEVELARAVAELKAVGGSAVIVDVPTGDVLAMASVPTLDPNDSHTWTRDRQVVRPVQTIYSPGSTFKPLMLAMAIDLGLVAPDELVNCKPDQGVNAFFGRRPIHDTHPEHYPPSGLLSLEDVIVESSNVGMARILTRLVPVGREKDTARMAPVHATLQKLGIGKPVGVPVAGEAGGMVTPLSQWSRNQTLVSVAFGHEVAVTPLQMAAIAATLSDGAYRTPRLVIGYEDAEGHRIDVPRQPPRQVFSPQSAELVRGYMRAVVERGQAKTAGVPGVPVAGKTGTTVDERDASKETHSFIALAPADSPRIALVVVLEQPKGFRYAAQTVAPPTGRILNRVLPYLGISGREP